jgi:hypothetical protein
MPYGPGGQPQQPPPQQPPPAAGSAAPREEPEAPVTATVDSSLTVSPWPAGQVAGADDSLIGRDSSKPSPQARHRYS